MRFFGKLHHCAVLGWKSSVFLILLSSIGVWAGMGYFSNTNTELYFANSFSDFLFLFLNLLPILILMVSLYGLTANAPFSVVFSGSLVLLMGAVNDYKITFREDPLVASDLRQFKEFFSILKGFDSNLLILTILLLCIFILLCIAMFYLFGKSPMNIWVRIVVTTIPLVVMLYSYYIFYEPYNPYNKYEVEGNIYSRTDCYASRGWQFSFLHEFDELFFREPDGYNKVSFQVKEQTGVTADTHEYTVKPHVIMIMSEAFTTTSENQHLSFEGKQDPLENYKKIAADAVISGELEVGVYGGGTANTEFEALTGMDKDNFTTGTHLYYLINQKVEGVPSILSDLGYKTQAFHPGDGWFYNRKNVYPLLGFDNYDYLGKGFTDKPELRGNYASETVTFNYLKESMEEHFQTSENPLFEFCVTIQNHGGYDKKYGTDLNLFQSDIPLTEEEALLLDNYFLGVIDSDREIGEFIEYTESLSEPVVVVYFGDHYPALGTAYETIGYDSQSKVKTSEYFEKYYTPFFIWQNTAAEGVTSMVEKADAFYPQENILMNAAYLGPALIQLLGMENMSPFFSFLNEMQKKIPVKTDIGYLDANNQFLSSLTEELEDMDQEYERWSYYKLMDEDTK